MKLSTCLTYSLLSATLFSVAACGGDGASFKDATTAQRERAITAGAGADAAMGFFYASFLSLIPPESACPRVTASGDTLTAVTNCTDEDGNILKGTITAQNVGGLFGPEADPSKPQIVTFDGFSFDDTSAENEDFAFDGKVTVEVGGQALVVDLRATLNGIEVTTDATFRSNADETMTSTDEGSSISVKGLGEADIKGSWNMSSESPAGALELHGDDVLKAEFGNVANGCIPLTIGGEKVGELCDTEE